MMGRGGWGGAEIAGRGGEGCKVEQLILSLLAMYVN